MHDMHKIAVDVTLTQRTSNEGINIHSERAIADMYKAYMKLEDTKVMGALDSDSITKSKKSGTLRAINLIKEKKVWKTKRENIRRWQAKKVLHT